MFAKKPPSEPEHKRLAREAGKKAAAASRALRNGQASEYSANQLGDANEGTTPRSRPARPATASSPFHRPHSWPVTIAWIGL